MIYLIMHLCTPLVLPVAFYVFFYCFLKFFFCGNCPAGKELVKKLFIQFPLFHQTNFGDCNAKMFFVGILSFTQSKITYYPFSFFCFKRLSYFYNNRIIFLQAV